jgi:uncharacterized membrane protein HdeD (DUF308 family)
MTTYYLPTLAGLILVLSGLANAVPALRRPASVVILVLFGAMVFTPDLALGLRVLAAMLTAMFAVLCVRRLRRS